MAGEPFIPTAKELIGRTLDGRYQVANVLATGGMSLLFSGIDERTNRSVAIKVMKPHDGIDHTRVQLFLREVEIAARLRHPHIVDVLDLGTAQDGTPYLIMELLSGRSLQAELKQRQRIPLDEALALLLPIMDALASVHDTGVIHRDVKPANIFLNRNRYGQVTSKLLDFGIAKALDRGSDSTDSGILGTPAYMAPEQVRHARVGPATDIWSMGAVFYSCLSGSPPFPGPNPAAILAALATRAPPPLEVAGLGRAVCAAIDRALMFEPASRYPSMRRFATALVASARTVGVQVSESIVPDAASLACEVSTQRQPEPRLERALESVTAREETDPLLGSALSRTDAPAHRHGFRKWQRLLLASAVLVAAMIAGLVATRPRQPLPIETRRYETPLPSPTVRPALSAAARRAASSAAPVAQSHATAARTKAPRGEKPLRVDPRPAGRPGRQAATPPRSAEPEPAASVFVSDLPVAVEW